eukprot:Awhi_evm1s11246
MAWNRQPIIAIIQPIKTGSRRPHRLAKKGPKNKAPQAAPKYRRKFPNIKKTLTHWLLLALTVLQQASALVKPEHR